MQGGREIVNYSRFVSKPEFALRKSRGEQFFFVNDRFIKVVVTSAYVAAEGFTMVRKQVISYI
jgi:DNA mismatch repair ATPase MutL